MYKQLSKLRIEKKSPFFVRKSKLFAWLLTIISISVFIASIAFLVIGAMNLINNLNSLYSNDSPTNPQEIKDQSLFIIDCARKALKDFDTAIVLLFSGFIVFFVVKLLATILNIVRYNYDYKLNVVPVKKILITRLIFQILIIVLLIGIIIVLSSIVKYTFANNPITPVSNIFNNAYDAINKITDQTNNIEQEIQSILDNMQQDLNKFFESLTLSNSLAFNYIAWFILLGGWIFSLIIYGITIKVMLLNSKKYFGDKNLKNNKNNKKGNKEKNKEKDETQNNEQENSESINV